MDKMSYKDKCRIKEVKDDFTFNTELLFFPPKWLKLHTDKQL